MSDVKIVTARPPLSPGADPERRRLDVLHHIANLPDNALLTSEEVAAWLLVEPAWVRAHANGNRRPLLPSIKVGKFRRFFKDRVSQFLRDLNG